MLRIHLGAFLLQWLYHLTDRQVDWAIKDNAAYQLLYVIGGVIDRSNRDRRRSYRSGVVTPLPEQARTVA
jgi:hypothetical protein